MRPGAFVQFTHRSVPVYVRVDDATWSFFAADGQLLGRRDYMLSLGREHVVKGRIQEKIDATASSRKAPSSGNPYGRFPEGVVMGILAPYEKMEDLDFLDLTDGLGLRILDQGFIEVYNGYPETLLDEFDTTWQRFSSPTDFRPWSLYTKALVTTDQPPDETTVRATAKALKLPEVNNMPFVFQILDPDKLAVYESRNRKSFDSQKKVMNNNSANEVARLLGLKYDGKGYSYEWLHLIAFSLGGPGGEAQVPYNLVLGTAGANTAMMSIEEFVKRRIKETRCTATISVFRHSPFDKCGWYANKLAYSVKFKGNENSADAEFSPLCPIAPTFDVEELTRQVGQKHGRSR